MQCDVPIGVFASLLCSSWSDMSLKAAWDFLNGGFVAGIAGAFFGAMAAARIAERSKLRDELTKEIRSANAAMSMSFTICNAFLALKRQHVRDVWAAYVEEKRRITASLFRSGFGVSRGQAIRLHMDMRLLNAPSVPIDSLQKFALEGAGVAGRAAHTVAQIAQSVNDLHKLMEHRNSLLVKFKVWREANDPDLVARYMGFPLHGGDTDTEYPDTLEGIARTVDDLIFFSKSLCQDLRVHALAKQNIFKLSNLKDPPAVSDVDFAKAKAGGLLPKDSNYPDWETAFPAAR
jgi:hypothetical protein